MKACVLHAIGDLRYEEAPKPEPKQGEVLIRVGACGVCGSDISRVFDKGTYSFPTIIGHEFAGTVEAAGEAVDASWIGKRVVVFPLLPCYKCIYCQIAEYTSCEDYNYLGSRCDGAFAEHVCAPVWNLLPVPGGVSMQAAAMAEPAAVALHALRQGGVDIGDTVAIFGSGPIGLMLAKCATLWGASKVLMMDIDPGKLSFAREQGFPHTFNSKEGDPMEWVKQVTGHGADLVIEGAGASPAFEQCMHAARPFGKVVLMGNPTGEMKLSQKGYWAILRKQLRISGTWNSSYSPLPRNEWKLALDLIAQGRLEVTSLITHRTRLEGLHDALVMMRDRTVFSNKVMYVAG